MPQNSKKIVMAVAPDHRTTGLVLGSHIDAGSWACVLDRLMGWAGARMSRYVAICNVHVVVTAWRDFEFQQVINGADLATPDGAPIAWMLRRLGFADQPRVNGPDLMERLFARCADESIAVYFFGSTPETLSAMEVRIRQRFPSLQIAGMESPPFRELTAEEDESAIAKINQSGAGIVFVGLGCPKQERWMAAHRGQVHAVMIGVGAAFDFFAGSVSRAPVWMQRHGLEWLHRLLSEPRRLWKRYLITNTLFIFGIAKQIATSSRQ